MGTIAVTERVPAPDTGRLPLALTGLLGLGGAVLVVAAFLPSPGLFLLATLVLAGTEIAATLRAPFLMYGLGRIQAGAGFRVLVQTIGLLVLLVRTDAPSSWLVGSAVGLLCLQAVRVLGVGLATTLRLRRKLPIVTRGLDLEPVRVPPAPPTLLTADTDAVLGWPGQLAVLGGGLAVLADQGVWLVLGFGFGVAASLAGAAVLGRAVLAMRAVPPARIEAAVRRALDKLRPEVVLYFGSGPETAYQLQMWLEPMERIRQPVLVILRDRELFRSLGPTRLPVLCVEHGGPLMGLDLPTVRLALYPSHAVGNLHMLRRRGVVHAFIGHGDSDKAVTSNPFLKAYDQLWVSGPAGRERMLDARVGIDDLDDVRLVEIGRPQTDELQRAEPTPSESGRSTVRVLYAPTWEGYEDQPDQSSVGPLGVELVRRLVAEPDVEVLYRPHPLLGRRSAEARAAHREILALLGNPALAEPVEFPDPYENARDDLDVVGLRSDQSRTELVAARAVWARKRLANAGHLLVPGPLYALSECFAAADALLCDVSSVITDFLATRQATSRVTSQEAVGSSIRIPKPFGVIDAAGLPGDEFAVRYPSSRGGYLVAAEGDGLTRLLSAARGTADPAAPDRAAAAEWLLGSAEPSAAVRLQRAVDAALEKEPAQ